MSKKRIYKPKDGSIGVKVEYTDEQAKARQKALNQSPDIKKEVHKQHEIKDLYTLLSKVLNSEIQIPDRIWCDECDAYAWECGCEHYYGKSVTQRYKEQLIENILNHFR